MTTIKPDTFAAIAGQVLNAGFTAYTSTAPNSPIIAMIDDEVWLGGSELLEYVEYSHATYRARIRCGSVWYESDSDDTDTVSRVLATACKRIESAVANLISA